MPARIKKICAFKTCRELTREKYCDKHVDEEAKRKKNYDKTRASAHRRGYNREWRRASKSFLANFPLCVACSRDGKTVIADVVDHIKPHKGDAELFWDADNWQGLCYHHHSVKTAAEDSSFLKKNIDR